MKTLYLITIKEGNSTEKSIMACSEDAANIYINASTLDEALTLLKGTSQEAEEAVKNYTPDPIEEPEEAPQHYQLPAMTIEKADAFIEEFRTTSQGARLLKSIELSKDLQRKHGDRNLSLYDLRYFLVLAYKNTFEALSSIFDYGYRKGYKKAQKGHK